MRKFVIEPKDCCGCQLCENICPFGAIKMQPNEDGFLYPVINPQKCTDCGICERKCPVKTIDTIKNPEAATSAISGYIPDDTELKKSASGGLATALYTKILREGGKVVGVRYCDGFKNAEYIMVGFEENLPALKSSKYIQADKGSIYLKVRDALKDGYKVMFIGLTCEVAALHSFLGKNYENLYTADIICQGPTTPKVAEAYINDIEEKYGSKTVAFSIRHKEEGWLPAYLRAEFADGQVHMEEFYKTSYGFLFRQIPRYSCHTCHFKFGNRTSDITIGDHWGVKDGDPEYNVNGVSVALINTEKGKQLMEGLPNYQTMDTDPRFAIENNHRYEKSTYLRPEREEISKSFREDGIVKTFANFSHVPFVK